MNKKGLLIVATVIKLMMAILVSLLLITAGVAIYHLFIPDNSAKDATQELNNLRAHLEGLSKNNPGPQSYITLKTPEWYLYSSEVGGECGGGFCLCVCKDIGCAEEVDKQTQACISTNRFTLIDKSFRHMPRPPGELILSFIDEKVFPFGEDKTIKENKEIKVNQYLSPLFFKYDNEWLWSGNLKTWQTLLNTTHKINNPLSDKGGEFMSSLFEPFLTTAQDKEQEGEDYLKRFNLKESNGIYLIKEKRYEYKP